jgi:hypothetical protein
VLFRSHLGIALSLHHTGPSGLLCQENFAYRGMARDGRKRLGKKWGQARTREFMGS